MKDVNNTNKSNTKMIVIITLLLVGLLSASYAFFSIVVFKNGTVYTTKGRAANNKPMIELVESNQGISITNTYPMTDTEGRNTVPFTFDVVNSGSYGAKYDLILETKSDNTLPNNLVKTYINSSTKLLTSYTTTSAQLSGYNTAYVIDSQVVLNAGQRKTYNLYVWVDSSATLSNAQNKTWISKLRLVATPT